MNYFLKILMLVGLFNFSSKLGAQEDEQVKENKYPETVLIKFIETTYGGASVQAESKIITVSPDNSVSTKALERASYLKDATTGLDYNLAKMRTEIQMWQNKGFHIQSMSSAAPMDYVMITTIILTKD